MGDGPASHALTVVEGGWKRVFGGKSITHRDDRGPRTVRQLTSNVVHQPDASHDESAAMEVHDDTFRLFVSIDSHRYAVDGVVPDATDVSFRQARRRGLGELEEFGTEILEGSHEKGVHVSQLAAHGSSLPSFSMP